jgi:hypothetical protein
MTRLFRRFLVLAVALMLLAGAVQAGVPAAAAQSVSVAWSQPIRLTNPEIQSWSPTIAADLAGNVHVLWPQTMMTGAPAGMGDTLYYARWDGEKWSTPSDVLVSPNNQGAEMPDIAVTPDGILHAVWGTGGANSKLMYSRAPACCAEDPHNWSKPVSLGGSVNLSSAIVSDSQGVLHMVYASLATNNIVYQQSTDSGATWSKPVEIDGAGRRGDEYPAYPRISVDLRGRIHLVWSVMPYPGRAVVYTRSDDGGKTWKEAVQIDVYDRFRYSEGYGPYLIDVEAVGEDTVHLTWDGAPTVERHHTWSNDGGDTWADPDTFIPELTDGGRALWNDMVVDSAGVLHAVSIKQPWAAQWIGGGWSQSVAIGSRSFAEDLRMTISRGNQLHVVWLEVIPGNPSVVYYVNGVSSAPAVPVQPLPEVPADALGLTQYARPTGTLVPTITPAPTLVDLPYSDVQSVESPGRAIFISAGAVLLFIVGVVIAFRGKKQ